MRLAAEELFHRLELLVRDGDGEDVLLEEPAALRPDQDAAAAGRAQVLRLQILLEPGHLAAHCDAPPHAAEGPGLAAREVRMRVGAESAHVPPLGALGPEEHPAPPQLPNKSFL